MSPNNTDKNNNENENKNKIKNEDNNQEKTTYRQRTCAISATCIDMYRAVTTSGTAMIQSILDLTL